MIIDSHIHFWNYNPVKDAWITDDMQAIQRDFLPVHLQPLLQQNLVDGCIAVQADQSQEETEFLVQLAAQSNFIKGVVGWIDLRAENIEDRLLNFSGQKIIKGWRHIVQAEGEGFLANEKFLHGISALAKFGYTYDVLVVARQLKEVLGFVGKFPGQRFVIDHCAKPGIKEREIAEWKILMKEIAANENVFCKLSGLVTEADWKYWEEKEMFEIMDVVFGAFGTSRVLFGSDWPVLNLAGNYGQWKGLVEKYLTHFSISEKNMVMGGNAIKFYG